MRYNVKTFHDFFVMQKPDQFICALVQSAAPITVAEALQLAKKQGHKHPIVQPCISIDHYEVYLHTLQQKARAAFHQQEQDAQEG